MRRLRRGSSPRAWGKVGPAARVVRAARIIPTSVGKSPFPSPNPAITPDHPHERGEKLTYSSDYIGNGGSSPRAWGKDTLNCSSYRISRIIPTSVGKSAGNRR